LDTTFTTLSGRKINYLKPGKIDLADVALGLSQMPRYAGQTNRPYSVAQHSLLVAQLCPEFTLYSLLHDAQEAFLCDLPTPLKLALRTFGESAYDELEWRLYKALCLTVDLEPRLPLPVKMADVEARKIEQRVLQGKGKCGKLTPILNLYDGGRVAWLNAVRERSFCG
jgi:hypothetical protein